MLNINKMITVKVTIEAPLDKVWQFWNEPEHIKNWYFASDDWHVPSAENDLKNGGKFRISMAAKDGSFGFDLEGDYTNIEDKKLIAYALADGRKVSIAFATEGSATNITEMFDPENTNPVEMQKNGWQAILNNFKKYVEAN